MMEFLRKYLTETRILIIGLGGILLFAFAAAIFGPKPTGSQVSTRDEGPNGAKALRTWLENGDYEVRELTSRELDPGDAEVLFVLDPSFEVEPADALRVQR